MRKLSRCSALGRLLVFFIAAVGCNTLKAAAPSNDNFASRIVLSGTNLTLQGSNTGASTEPGENIGGGLAILTATVWYAWTAPTGGVVYFSGTVQNPSFNFSIGTYQGTALDALTTAPATPDGGVPVAPGDTIILQIGSVYYPLAGGGGTGPFTLKVRMALPAPTSPNDSFANPLAILLPEYHFEGSIFGASVEPGEPLPGSNTLQTLWWNFHAAEEGLLSLMLSAGQFAADLKLYEGTQLNSLALVTPVADTRYRVHEGQQYFIQLASGHTAAGSFTLDTRVLSMTNDMFAGRDYVRGTNWTYVGNATFATREPDEPQTNWANTVWMSWTAPFTGRVYLAGVAPQTHAYAVYTGSALAELKRVPVAGVVQELATMIIQQGVEYHFQFTGGPDDFALAINVQEPFVHATNDNFISAQRFQGEGGGCCADSKSFLDATMEPGEPLHLGSVPQKSLWYKWQAPRYGNLGVSLGYNFLTNDVVLAGYQGTAVNALTLLGKGTNGLHIPVEAGETYYVAAAVPADSSGDILPAFSLSQGSSAVHPVPGNLLANPSFEGAAPNGPDWNITDGFGGHFNEGGGADGVNWPIVPLGGRLWQDIVTIPGRQYRLRFAYHPGLCCGIAGARAYWDGNDLGIVYAGMDEPFWHWSDYVVTASNTLTRVTWENVHVAMDMDAFSVIDLNAPPQITRDPVSIATLQGGTAVFIVESLGTRPLHYQWRFNGTPISPGTDKAILTLQGLNPSAAGGYSVVVTNNFGAAISQVALLTIDSPTNATILVQPYGDTVPSGGYYNFSVVAYGLPALKYQWYFNSNAVADATNRNLTFTNVSLTNAGSYHVRVQDGSSSVYSLTAFLVVTNAINGGSSVEFRNRNPSVNLFAPVYDVDGTLLSGPAFVAQLYAGTTVEGLRAINFPVPFRTNATLMGYFLGPSATLPNVSDGSSFLAQVRVWESVAGTSYEEARALGGKFGKSQILQLVGTVPPNTPAPLTGLQSFNLQAGLPRFSVGVIEMVERQPHGIILWVLHGEPGFRYVIEKSTRPNERAWFPYAVLTNITGSVTFTDSANSGSGVVLYRSRILD